MDEITIKREWLERLLEIRDETAKELTDKRHPEWTWHLLGYLDSARTLLTPKE